MALINVEQALAQIRGGDEIDEEELTEFVEAASAMIVNHLKDVSPYEAEVDSTGAAVVDSNGDAVYTDEVRREVQHATKMLTAMLWRHRDDNGDGVFQSGFLPAPIVSILAPLRTPTVA